MSNNQKMLKTVIVGVGIMGQNHARVLSEISTLVAVCDINERQGKKVARKYGAEYFKDYRNLSKRVDAAIIAVPTYLHEKVAVDILSQGIDILVEKPLSDSTKSCLRIVNYAKKMNRILAVGQIERFNPAVRKAKELIDSKEWGEVISISARRFSNYPSRIRDVGVIFDLSIHDIDIIRYLINTSIDSVVTYGGRIKNGDFEDYANILLKFADGKVGLCETNWLTPRKVRKISITTTTHYVQIDLLSQEITISKSTQFNTDPSNLYSSPIEFETDTLKLTPEEPLGIELSNFIYSVKHKSKPLVDGEDGLQSVRIVEAALESLKTKKIVNIV